MNNLKKGSKFKIGQNRKGLLIGLILILFLYPKTFHAQIDKKQPNIVFIAIDDMNDWTGFLGGHPQTITPNMDKLAQEGVNFTNAHCPAPGCSPSRNAILFGVEPFNSGLYPFYSTEIHEDLNKKYVSLPRFLKENGYETYGAGKIHHGSKADPEEWTDYLLPTKGNKEFAPNEGYIVGNDNKMSFRPTINAYEDHTDYKVASYGLDVIKNEHNKPFFLAVGIVKPHLPFDSPKEFFDALPKEILAPEILDSDIKDIPKEGNHFRRVGNYKTLTKADAWEEVRRAYLACISWADYNVGRVIDALEASPYADNTVVVLWSDHGFHLGEKKTFKKFTLWEEATRVPFIIKDLRKGRDQQGLTIDQPVSLINIYKTLAEMSGLETPEYVDGISLLPQLEDAEAEIKNPAIISWGRGNYAVRTKDWRYIKYFDGTEELYNHKTDANEWNNLAEISKFQSKIAELKKNLPKSEAPMVKEHVALWSVYGADKELMEKKLTQKEKEEMIRKNIEEKKLRKQRLRKKVEQLKKLDKENN
ncbi:sulfatase [Christiangramia crocea]|uniref:Sulfatase-like hydrolase/transferase n=1 Tax=Christiangramia crocea TaxID=2904124 RepID=A0A9X2A700_9FLAO|nr:sulfatase-like hydrolase/transferase [Gramella crocea]MCG9972540.1 sulfatase-like hydrolase/transferase [Gramella crocea]